MGDLVPFVPGGTPLAERTVIVSSDNKDLGFETTHLIITISDEALSKAASRCSLD